MKKLYKDIGKGKSYFYYFGWSIIVFLLAFFLLFFFIFQARFYVKRTERIEFFIAAYGMKNNDYNIEIQKEFKKDGLIEANFYSYIESDPNVFSYFEANGEGADFIIFSETNIKDMNDYVKYHYVDVSSLKSDIPNIEKYETFKYEDISYGLKIFDGGNEEYNAKFSFTDLIEFTQEGKEKESYYLLINNQSPNFDKEKGHTLGYSVLQYFLTNHEK